MNAILTIKDSIFLIDSMESVREFFSERIKFDVPRWALISVSLVITHMIEVFFRINSGPQSVTLVIGCTDDASFK